jgi:hypothetical protein
MKVQSDISRRAGEDSPSLARRLSSPERRRWMEYLILLVVLAAWIVLQVSVLPRLGVKT